MVIAVDKGSNKSPSEKGPLASNSGGKDVAPAHGVIYSKRMDTII
jgi:hypothetical protein